MNTPKFEVGDVVRRGKRIFIVQRIMPSLLWPDVFYYYLKNWATHFLDDELEPVEPLLAELVKTKTKGQK